MEMSVKFNSKEELMEFVSMFGAKDFVPAVGVNNTPKVPEEVNVAVKIDGITVENGVIKEKAQKEVPNVEAEKVGVDTTPVETKEAENIKEEPKVTKEQVRAVFTKLIQAGKQKEAKELTSKYGAAKLPDVKEEDYAAILKEAEELL